LKNYQETIDGTSGKVVINRRILVWLNTPHYLLLFFFVLIQKRTKKKSRPKKASSFLPTHFFAFRPDHRS